jgi:hypothetical protein
MELAGAAKVTFVYREEMIVTGITIGERLEAYGTGIIGKTRIPEPLYCRFHPALERQ